MAGTYPDQGVANRLVTFKREFQLEYQKMDSELKPYVTIDTDFAGEYKNLPKLGTVGNMRKRSQRYEKVDLDTMNENVRRMTKGTYDKGYVFDNIDLLYGALDMQSGTASQMKMLALNTQDKIIVDCLSANAVEGKDGLTSVAFPNSQIIESTGATGATFEKLLLLSKAKKLNHIPSSERLTWFVDPFQMNELLTEDELVSLDYNSKRDLEKGRILSWGDIDIVECTCLPVTTANIRDTYAFVKSAVTLGITQDVNFRKATLPENSFVEMLYMDMTMGACRTRDEGVWKLPCAETGAIDRNVSVA